MNNNNNQTAMKKGGAQNGTLSGHSSNAPSRGGGHSMNQTATGQSTTKKGTHSLQLTPTLSKQISNQSSFSTSVGQS